MHKPQYLLYALLSVVVFSLVYVLLTSDVQQAVAGVVVGTVLSLLANLITSQVAAADAARKQRAERELAEASSRAEEKVAIRRRRAEAYEFAVESLSYLAIWGAGSAGQVTNPQDAESLAEMRRQATKSLATLLLVTDIDDPLSEEFERLYWQYIDSAQIDTARELLANVIALRTAERGESNGHT